MYKMNEKVKPKWLSALRGGKYPQIEGQLKKDDGFCCLGVLSDLASKEGIGEWGCEFEYDDGSLSEAVCKWAGLLEDDPEVNIVDEDDAENVLRRTLSMLNDSGSTFKEIADLIEAQL